MTRTGVSRMQRARPADRVRLGQNDIKTLPRIVVRNGALLVPMFDPKSGSLQHVEADAPRAWCVGHAEADAPLAIPGRERLTAAERRPPGPVKRASPLKETALLALTAAFAPPEMASDVGDVAPRSAALNALNRL